MRYMLLRRASAADEAGRLPSPAAVTALAAYTEQLEAAGVLRASERLLPSTHGVRLALSGGKAGVVPGPFADHTELIAGFVIIDVPSRQDALDWLGRWPAEDADAEIELREGGCPGGCAEVKAEPGMATGGKHFAVLLRSSPDLEAETPVTQDKLDALDIANAREAKKGVLLAADGLRTSALGVRLKPVPGKLTFVDGPFTEIKEMIAGYWLIRAASMQEALAWAERNPYPCGPEVEVEIREVADESAVFTPALRVAEQRMRDGQLEAGMHAPLSAHAAWR